MQQGLLSSRDPGVGVAPGWSLLARHWAKDAQLFLAILLVLVFFRLLLLALFHQQMADVSDMGDVLAAVFMGLRLDMATAASWVLASFLLSLLLLRWPLTGLVQGLRLLQARLFATLGVLILLLDMAFFATYGEHYNQMVFGLFYDDTRAILTTLWKEYHPLPALLLFVLLAHGVWRLLRMVLHYDAYLPVLDLGRLRRPAPRVLGVVLALLGMLLAMRGGTVTGAPLTLRHLSITADTFLNHTIPNPFFSLRNVATKYWLINSDVGVENFWPADDLTGAARVAALAGQDDDLADIDAMTRRSALGLLAQPPRHVFLILMESYSGWTVLPAWRGAGFANAASRLAQAGIYFPHFIPATWSTAQSLNTLVSGLPPAGYYINYEPRALQTFPTAIAAIFRRLGYRTRFFYGGFIGWQRMDTFLPAQGFDEVYGGGHMAAGKDVNEWGVDDQYLFDFVRDTVSDETPSFNFILTTSNHPPYDLDLDALGYPVKQLPAAVVDAEGNALHLLGHHWYADREMGRFVSEVEQKLPRTLFAITGDHPGRMQLTFPGDNVYEQEIVPFILYGSEVLQGLTVDRQLAGSHLDIGPTLVELSAPAGFQYHAFGQSMFHKTRRDVGYSQNVLIGSDFIAYRGNIERVYKLPDAEPAPRPDLAAVAEQVRARLALSWYRGKRGSQLLTRQ